MIMIAAALLASDLLAAEWKIDRRVDEITDEVSFSIFTRGEQVKDGILDYVPTFAVHIYPKSYEDGKMTYRSETMFAIKAEGMMRTGVDVSYRLDRRKPVTETWTTSTERHAAFSPRAHVFNRELISATNLVIRFETTLGNIRTLKFRVDGLRDQMLEVKRRFAAEKAK